MRTCSLYAGTATFLANDMDLCGIEIQTGCPSPAAMEELLQPLAHYAMACKASTVPPGVCTRYLFRGRCRHAPCRFSHEVVRAANVNTPRKPQPSRSSTSSGKAVNAPPDFDVSMSKAEAVPPPPFSGQAWRSVDFLLQGESVRNNPYLAEFAAAPWLSDLLSAPECSSLLCVRGKSLRKEMSEAFGSLNACKRALRKLGVDPLTLSQPSDASCYGSASLGSGTHVTIVDLCCGKGFGSLVLALSLPCVQVLAVDVNPNMELAHFRKCPNLAFLEMDITKPDAGLYLAEAISQTTQIPHRRQLLVVVGVHLCGALSVHASRLFAEVPAPTALVLVPCCLDGRRPEIKRRARRLRVDPHFYWCLSLLAGLQHRAPDCRRELFNDDDVLSEKNSFLIATRTA